MSHYWGDDWEHWDELYKAEKWIVKFYEKVTGKYMITKEKYGTIRFEFEYKWITNEHEKNMFKETIRRAVKRFKNVAGEITNDAGHVLDDEFFAGWCQGISFYTTGSYWISDKRPRGV